MPIDLENELNKAGRRLTFCDETALDGQPVPTMVANIEIICGVTVASDAYPEFRAGVVAMLTGFGPAEFHAKEVVNPNARSPWKAVSPGDRVSAFQTMSDLLRDHVESASYAFISQADFDAMKAEVAKVGAIGIGQKSALRKVFLGLLAERLAAQYPANVLVIDQVKRSLSPQIFHLKVGKGLVGGGAIVAKSSAVAGLQLADMAAFCISRYVRKRAAIEAGEAKPFDRIAMKTIADLQGKLGHVVNRPVDA